MTKLFMKVSKKQLEFAIARLEDMQSSAKTPAEFNKNKLFAKVIFSQCIINQEWFLSSRAQGIAFNIRILNKLLKGEQ